MFLFFLHNHKRYLLLSVCLIGRILGRLFQDGVCNVLSVLFDYRISLSPLSPRLPTPLSLSPRPRPRGTDVGAPTGSVTKGGSAGLQAGLTGVQCGPHSTHEMGGRQAETGPVGTGSQSYNH